MRTGPRGVPRHQLAPCSSKAGRRSRAPLSVVEQLQDQLIHGDEVKYHDTACINELQAELEHAKQLQAKHEHAMAWMVRL
jgi:hypothetical protein